MERKPRTRSRQPHAKREAKPATVDELFTAMGTQGEAYIRDGHEHAAQLFLLRKAEGDDARYWVETIVVAPIEEPAHNFDAREAHADMMAALVEPYDAYIFLSEAWMLNVKSRDEVEQHVGHVKEHPDRVETFQLHFVSKLGKSLMRQWRIVREPGKLTRLEQWGDDFEKPLEGRHGNLYAQTFPPTAGKGN